MLPWAYPLIMLLALGTGSWLLRRSQQTLDLTGEQRIAIGLSAFAGAMLGAKLPFLFYDWSGFMDGSAWLSSGKTIMCGMVGAYLAVELAKWGMDIRTKTGDSFVVPVAVSVAIGRLGCLSAGCCFGIPTTVPWAIRCSVLDEQLRHPNQMYESGFHLLMAGLAWQLGRRGIWKGQLAKLYILSYLLFRLMTETLRPEPRMAYGMTLYQWFALAMIPVFVWLWYRDSCRLTSA